MIDFRYHLVSLVSVFLALAVGIVLGAGPLKGTIADTLSSSVDQLRAEAANLRTQRDTAQTAADNRDTFTTSVLPVLVGGQLPGDRIVLITLPGADNDAVKPLTQALTDAGATVTGQIDIKEAWTDPAKAKDRAAAVAALADPTAAATAPATTSAAGVAGAARSATAASPTTASPTTTSPTTAGPTTAAGTPAASVAGEDQTAGTLSTLLARALVTRALQLKAELHPAALLDGLRKAGLVGVTGDVTGVATEAVLLAPSVVTTADKPTASAAGSDPTPGWAALAAGLDARSDGVVVVGPASSATTGGVLATIRSQQAVAKAVSTIDTGGTPMGDVTTVLALREQSLGGVGSYGFVGKVDAPLPARAGATKP